MAASQEWLAEWDYWPLLRYLIVLAAMGLLAHYWLGWTPALRGALAWPRRFYDVFSLIMLFSSVLARGYLLALVLPLYGTVVLNDWFYDTSRGVLRVILRLRPGFLLLGLAFGGELVLFGGLFYVLRQAILTVW